MAEKKLKEKSAEASVVVKDEKTSVAKEGAAKNADNETEMILNHQKEVKLPGLDALENSVGGRVSP